MLQQTNTDQILDCLTQRYSNLTVFNSRKDLEVQLSISNISF